MPTIMPFTQLGKNDIPTAGGKGANLGELVQAGFPVPPGFVLTTMAYEAFVDQNGLRPQIIDLAAKVSADEPQSFEDVAQALKNLFLAAEMPAAVRADLLAAYAELTNGGETAVAVRSSATAEDLPTASFAGQQDSFLNVQGEAALLEAVKNCWASLWTARAMAYRLRQGIDPAVVSLAVVVQQLIPADCAGILFTANPLDGRRDQMVINAAWGLGEAVVGGLVTPDVVTVDKENWQIIDRQTAVKTTMTALAGTGTTEQLVPPARQNQDVLADKIVLELAQSAARIEAYYEGVPLDIEWALSDNKLFILQARPITNLPPPPLREVRWESPKPDTIWMRRQIVEHMPDPLSPLFAELYVEEGMGQSIDEMADFLSDLSDTVIDPWDFVEPPFATTINGFAYSIASFKLSWKLFPMVLRVYAIVLPKMLRHLMPRWRDQAIPAYQAKIAYWSDINLGEAADETLLQGIQELAYEDIVYWFAASVPLGLARITDVALDRFLKFAVKESQLSSGYFLRGFPSKTVEAQARLEAIAGKIRSVAGLQERVIKMPAARLPAVLAEQPDILDELNQYLAAYGHQIYNLDFAAPTLADEPLPVYLSVKTAVTYPERDVRAQQAAFVEERQALTVRTNRSLNPLLRPIFEKLLNWAQAYAPNRELALFYVGAAWPALRRLALELGQRLTTADILNDPDDVFYLKSAELAEAAAARAAGTARPDLAELALDRRLLRQARMRLDPPAVVPPDGRMKFGPIDMALFEPKPRTDNTGPRLAGFAVSPGKVTAPASIVRTPADFHKMTPDTILVCPTTTPAWTPLFSQAKGLVTDIGGALAHGSIVAREYGIPAVMGTAVATQRITAGQLITVDGDQGVVTLVDEVDEQAEARLEAQQAAEKQAARQRKTILALVIGALVVWWLWWRKRS